MMELCYFYIPPIPVWVSLPAFGSEVDVHFEIILFYFIKNLEVEFPFKGLNSPSNVAEFFVSYDRRVVFI